MLPQLGLLLAADTGIQLHLLRGNPAMQQAD